MSTITADICPTHSRQAARMLEFYSSNPNRFILPRPESEFLQAVKRRWHFLVEKNGRIMAGSGIFDYSDDQPFVEVSETLILPPLQGFRLQGFLFRIRIAAIVVTQGPTVGITTAVDPGNTRSMSSVRRQGFQTWSRPIEEVYSSCPTCPNNLEAIKNRKRCWCDYFILPIDAARANVRQLLEDSRDEKKVRLKNSNGDELVIDFSRCLAIAHAEYREMLQEFVRGAVW